MRYSLNEHMARIFEIWKPGIDQFYRQMNPDPWSKAIDEFEQSIDLKDPEHSIQALTAFEYRRKRMLELYQQFLEVLQVEPQKSNPVQFEWHENRKRLVIQCDRCGNTVMTAHSITLTRSERIRPGGDPEEIVASICSECERSIADRGFSHLVEAIL